MQDERNDEAERTRFEDLDHDLIRHVNVTFTVIEFQCYLNAHGWTMDEYCNKKRWYGRVKQ